MEAVRLWSEVFHRVFAKKYLAVAILLIAIVAIVIVVNFYTSSSFFSEKGNKLEPGELIVVDQNSMTKMSREDTPAEVEYEIVAFAENLYVPWSMVFTASDRMLVTERDGEVRVILDGQLQNDPIRVFSEVSANAEEGLMGMALDPNYNSNNYIYFCYAYSKAGKLVDKVVRVVDSGNTLSEDTVILDDIPAARFHAGCSLRFGPDDKLYITTGDATDKDIAQDRSSLGGKILRINADGSIPEDNPFPQNPVWSYGHRNPQGIDWHPVLGVLWSTEHGPSTFDGPPGGDEVNVIVKGGNYGWPLVSHEESQPGLVDPKLVFTPAFAPASGMFYESKALPQFTNNFFFGVLRGEGIMRVIVSEETGADIVAYERFPDVEVGRIRDIVEGPDGSIYFSTSNRDGRGDVRQGDDKIYKITPRTNDLRS